MLKRNTVMIFNSKKNNSVITSICVSLIDKKLIDLKNGS